MPPGRKPPKRRRVEEETYAGAYDTALTEVYGAKEELNLLNATDTQERLKSSIDHLGSTNELTNQQAGLDSAALSMSQSNRQSLYAQDTASIETMGEYRTQLHEGGVSALQTARDNQLAGYDLDLESLGGRGGLLGARHEKGQADLADDAANQRQSAYNAALGSMYSGGSAAGLAQSADQSLADTASRAQGSVERQSSLLDTEYAQAKTDVSTQIAKTQLGRQSVLDNSEHRLNEAGVKQQMDLQNVRQQVERLRTQSGADRDEGEYRQARADLTLQLQNEVSANNIAIQEQSLALSQATQPLEAQIFSFEQVNLFDRKAANTFEMIMNGGN